ncbi:dihydrolipoamide acetyltransferase family protein [Ohessyouella blattaphilus]|uniref:Dihydrolipoamide acetyltransferase component of pyruvate dehydrogenase complex n=1 Tax=Ohessyouella blattaphilus TaxID=2949333 RepID=A0ABT1EE64_9FIRM|nr:dihydrolipoamide acetyltransferase family protein [Ohessyouella blattaphilus]MCP1108928.1 2-oxo acid dehydrogenase subunit E2 [Ohessyouella blattaphilus]MCR8562322.1 2-oxo acid dehydrogenase subunit E2 [Ohessyouella blattaphilus]MDL2249021.1 2-oxo acid dehydrogenase subunit E2 [Lachnospiraceae bacterium OttesenSCG-928-J05]
MIKEITMPAGGQTTDTSTIGTWLVKEGDQVKRGDALLEVETDKATMTVESFAKGTVLKILAATGDTRTAGDVIAYIGDESDVLVEETTTEADAKAEDIKDEEEYQPIDRQAAKRIRTEEQSAPVKATRENVKAMPNAKRLAAEFKVSLAEVAEFHKIDIVKKADVQAYLDASPSGNQELATESGDVEVPLSSMRKVIAKRMLESSQSIPVFHGTIEVDMEECIALRQRINSSGDLKVSYNDILFKCLEAAIRKYPNINASYTDTAIIQHKDVNIGLAVAAGNGLVVPVVSKVNKKNIAEISAQNKTNIEKARNGKLAPADMSGGSVTISNLGMYDISEFTAIINPPEVCILALGKTELRPVYKDGAFVPVQSMKITASFDHRLIDGAYGAEFLTELKKIIEQPALALV